MVGIHVACDGSAMYQGGLPLLHPIFLLLLQLFDIVWHQLSNGKCAFKCGSNVHAALNLLGHVAHDGLGDGENVAEACRHVKVVVGDNKELWWRQRMVVV